jgi:hypothetical protein
MVLAPQTTPPPTCSVQAIGTSIWASAKAGGNPDQGQILTGSYIVIAGLAVQMLFFVAFTVLTIWTHRHPE